MNISKGNSLKHTVWIEGLKFAWCSKELSIQDLKAPDKRWLRVHNLISKLQINDDFMDVIVGSSISYYIIQEMMREYV